ncbi:neprilysin-like isoform X3 [Ruditapes philippinarum]|uniref:neprilysin-like isoform X3 n=1 Tax=Ruditapes philippinarum TaxID=129788 RepID=UPI00295AFF7A|nr:neprilysin-like isoform X3 [Ruditapes philippinarum]
MRFRDFKVADSTEQLATSRKYKLCKGRVKTILLAFFIASTIALALAVIVILIKHSDTNPKGPNTQSADGVCLTPGCVIAAARVMSAMDMNVNPCDDFYNFACGTWVRQHVIPEDKSSFGTFTKLRDDVSVISKSVLEASNKADDAEAIKKSRNYYKACINEDKIEELGLTYIQKYMDGFGGWPVLGSNPGGNWNSSDYNIEDLLIYSRKGTNYLPLIDVGVTQDDKHPTKHILYIDQPDLGMPSRDYYLKGRDDKTLMAYQTMIQESAVAFGADETTAANDAKDIVDMEIELANITVPKEERRDPEKLYNKMTLGELSNNFTGVDWKKLVKGTMQIIGLSIDDSEPVLAIAPPFLEKIGDLLTKYSSRVIVNYVLSRRVLGKTFYLPKVFTDIKLKYRKVLSGSATESPRWQSCGDNVKNTMPEVVGRLFVEDAFRKEAKKDVLDLVGKLRVSFKGMIDDLPWMESATKQVAKEKADFIEPRIGYSDVVYNDSALNAMYENVTVYTDDPLRTLISASEAAVIKRLYDLRKDVDKNDWDMSPATVNAYYNPETNQITFPAAILQPPFYSHDQPAYLNYGGIGYVIGHEITHGFDDQGRLYDKTGNLHSWWSDTDAAKFKERAQCIIDQYSNFTVPGTGGMTLNGVNTQGENIADNGGIKESYYAYREWIKASRNGKEEDMLPGMNYTSSQLYFLNAAQVWCENMRDQAKIERILTDPHSIDMFRVYGPMQNFDEFSKAWNCPVGSYMNPAKKCAVW